MEPNDIEILMECLRADFRIIVKKTELWSSEACEQYLADIEKLLEKGYIDNIEVVLKNKLDQVLRVNKYHVQKLYGNSQNDRPGNIDWDGLDASFLTVLINMSNAYLSLPSLVKTNIMSELGGGWGYALDIIPYDSLRKKSGKVFSGNNSHINRIDYTNGIN